MELNKDINLLLARTNLSISFYDYLNVLENYFPIEGIKSFSSINQGYEDANFVLIADKGKFVLKIFGNFRSEKNIADYAKVLQNAVKIGIPVTQLVDGKDGPILRTKQRDKSVYAILTKFCDGQNFEHTTPSLDDIKQVTVYLAKLNTLDFPIEESYDSWGNKNLLKEYELNKNKLSKETHEIINQIVDQFSELKLSTFNKAVIHGDMQRKHVLKDNAGNYCILDFGCMAYDPIVVDLSTYLGWFCFQKDTWGSAKIVYNLVLEEYKKVHQLSIEELESIPVMVRASYAAYFMKTSVLISEGDTSEETKVWNSKAKEMFELSKDWF